MAKGGYSEAQLEWIKACSTLCQHGLSPAEAELSRFKRLPAFPFPIHAHKQNHTHTHTVDDIGKQSLSETKQNKCCRQIGIEQKQKKNTKRGIRNK